MRALPADSLEYFAETTGGNTGLPAETEEPGDGADGAVLVFLAGAGEELAGLRVVVALGAGVVEAGAEGAAAFVVRHEDRNVLRSAPFSPCDLACELQSFMRSRWLV